MPQRWFAILFVASAAQAAPRLLHLEEAVQLAKAHQPQLRQAAASVGVVESRETQARAAWLPQLNASGLLSRSKGTYARVGSPVGGALATESTTWSLGLTATQTLWDFGAIERYRAAGKTVEAAQATERAINLSVVLSVRRAFFTTQAQHELVRVGEETLRNQQKHLEQIQGFVQAGIRTGIDLAQARTAVATAQLQLINAKNAYHLAKASLVQVMGVVDLKDFDVADDELPPISGEGGELDAMVQAAFDQRPELLSLRRQDEAQVLTVMSARSGFIPTLGATGSVSEASNDLNTLGLNWSAGLNLSWNLFSGGLTSGQVNEALFTAESLKAQLDSELLQVRVDVEQARATIEDGLSAVTAAQSVLDAARAQLSLAEGRYTSGVGSTLELGDAQVQVTTAAAELVQARLTLSTARAQLVAALGNTP